MFNGGIVAALQYNLDDVLNVFAHVYPATTPLGSVLFTGYITGNGRLFGFGRYGFGRYVLGGTTLNHCKMFWINWTNTTLDQRRPL